MTLKKVLEFIKEHELIKSGDRILIGLSGGADSVCLTHILCSLKSELGIELYTAHLNHGIRGTEAERDERFAEEFSKGLGIKCFVGHADVKEESTRRRISEELCGREARYSFFREVMDKNGINKTATAHNKNDNAETILMNFIRGSSLSGLCGIPFKRGSIIRPILTLTRDEIIGYINDNGLKFVTDSTNLENVYTRNKIRLELIPKIQAEFNSNFIEIAVKNSENIRCDKELLELMADEASKRCVYDGRLDIELFKREHISLQRRILYRMLTEKTGVSDISSSYIDDIMSLIRASKTGKRIDLPQNTEAVMGYDFMAIRKKIGDTADFEYALSIDTETVIKELGITAMLERAETPDKSTFTVPDGAKIAIRNRRNGDYFYPEGMEGRKKLKDYFIDEKIDRSCRKNIGIMTVDGDIAYVIGKRRDRRFAFRDKGVRLVIRYN